MVKIDNKTFSKSRGYVIWLEEDYLKNGFHPDLLRYYLSSYTSHTKELNFSWDVFQEKINNEIIASLGNFIYRTLLLTYKNFGVIPEGRVDEEVIKKIGEVENNYIDAILNYEFKKAIDGAMSLSDFGNVYFQSKEPWKLIKEDRESSSNVLKGCIQIIKALIVLLEPVMPRKMEEVRESIHLSAEETSFENALVEIESGIEINKPKILFEKIADEKITEMKNILDERLWAAEKRHDI
jgi:methionyl-tRNA synthetase